MQGRVRRARLNYLRELEGKAARIKGEKRDPTRDRARRRRAAASAAAAAAARRRRLGTRRA